MLTVAFALSRIGAAAAGVRYDDSVLRGTPLTDMWQLLDVHLLRHHLLDSVWHLNSQPPLFNLYCGFLLHLPPGLRGPSRWRARWSSDWRWCVCAYLLQVELAVPRVVALVVTLVAVVASPAYLLYENWLNYAYPTAAVGTVGAWCLVRFLRTGRARFGVGYFAAAAVVVLLDSTYQIAWLLVAAVPVAVVMRRRWRTVVAVAAVPVVVVAAWYVKDYVQVGTTTTSSWLGMNLARSVLYLAPPDQVAVLERQGRLDALASVPPFSGPEAYTPRFVDRRAEHRAGRRRAAEGRRRHQLQQPAVRQDLGAVPPRRPGVDPGPSPRVRRRRRRTPSGSGSWPPTRTSPTRPTGRPSPLHPRLRQGRRVAAHPGPGAGHRRVPARVAPAGVAVLQALVVYALALVGAPVLAWRRRRADPALAGTLAVLWWTTAYRSSPRR